MRLVNNAFLFGDISVVAVMHLVFLADLIIVYRVWLCDIKLTLV